MNPTVQDLKAQLETANAKYIENEKAIDKLYGRMVEAEMDCKYSEADMLDSRIEERKEDSRRLEATIISMQAQLSASMK